jgi:DNA-binding NtrC family response regulator
VPVIVLSAFADTLSAAERWYAADVIVKPFDLDDLLETIARTLQRRSSGLGGDPGRSRFMHA